MTIKRKANTPKKYPQKSTDNPRKTCPMCGKNMYKSRISVTIEGKRQILNPNYQCGCGNIVKDMEEIKKIPD